MRILVKWCEELENNLEIKKLYEREEPLRRGNGNEDFASLNKL